MDLEPASSAGPNVMNPTSAAPLPRPRALARRMLAWAWGSDAPALAADIGETLADRAGAGAGPFRLWLWAWWQILRSAMHGVGAPAGPGSGANGRMAASGPFGRGPRLRLGLALRLALRGLRRDPTTSATVTGILALGVTAPAVFFSLLWGGGLRTLPVPDGERVVRMEVLHPRSGGAPPATMEDLEGLRTTAALEGVEGYAAGPMRVAVPGWGTVELIGAALTPGALDLVGVAPVLGVLPRAGEPREVLLGYGPWSGLFDADPGIVGREVMLGGRPAVVTGVMPEGFGFPTSHHAWSVLGPDDRTVPLELFGRLADGADEDAASAALTGRWRQRDAVRDAEIAGATIRVQGFTKGRGEGAEAVIFFGLVVVGVALLVIAAVNAANLLMVRAVERTAVLGVQAALGAARIQLAAQLLFEALLLSAAGGVIALGLTHLSVEYIQRTASGNFGYWWMRMAVELPVVLFVVLLVLGTALLAGLAPVRTVMRADLQRVLKHGASGAPKESVVARVITSAQLALSCGALVAAGLASQAIGSAADFGEELPAREVVLAPVGLPGETAEENRATLAGLRDMRVDGRTTVAWGAPGFREPFRPFSLPDRRDTGVRLTAGVNAVDPGYFGLFDIELLRGRLMTGLEGADDPGVAVVNRAWAEVFLPGEEALGRPLTFAWLDSTRVFEIVGVVESVPLGLTDPRTEVRIYLPLEQAGLESLMVLGRRATDPTGLVREIRQAVQEVDRDIAVGEAMTLEEGHRWMTRAQFTLSLLAAGGGYAGLLVAAVGLYALLAFRVRRRHRELGVRLAMGADGARLGREIIGYALRQIAPAMVVGLALAWAGAPVLGAILLGQGARAPGTYLGVAAVFLLVGVGVSLRPALTAARVAPASALRSE